MGKKNKEKSEKVIKIDTIKSILSLVSLSVLAIQHFMGILVDNCKIAYVPLIVTFGTIYINAFDNNKMKVIEIISLIGVIILSLSGIMKISANEVDLQVSDFYRSLFERILYLLIVYVSFLLCIFNIKRLVDAK